MGSISRTAGGYCNINHGKCKNLFSAKRKIISIRITFPGVRVTKEKTEHGTLLPIVLPLLNKKGYRSLVWERLDGLFPHRTPVDATCPKAPWLPKAPVRKAFQLGGRSVLR